MKRKTRSSLCGKIFGNLKVIIPVKGSKKWLCYCKCGNYTKVHGSNLTTGKSKTCGCRILVFKRKYITLLQYHKDIKKWKYVCNTCNNISFTKTKYIDRIKSCGCSRRRDISNQTFGKLTAIKFLNCENTNAIWLCRCSCGRFVKKQLPHLVGRVTSSCGCLKLKMQTKLLNIIKEEFYPLYDVRFNYRPEMLYNKKTKRYQHVDIALLKNNKLILAIEYDGRQHFEPVNFGGISNKLALLKHTYQIKMDERKDKVLKNNKIPLIRFTFKDKIIKENIIERLRQKMQGD